MTNFAIANFGFVPYGKSVSGLLQTGFNKYGKINEYGCEDLNQIQSNDFQHFVILKRNPESDDCSAVTQSMNAYKAGYRLVILMDYKNEDLEYLNIEDNYHNSYLPIPVIIVKQTDGDILFQDIQSGRQVDITVFFPPPNKQEIVQIELWLDTMDWQSYMFVINLENLLDILGDKAIFTPHFPLFSCYECEANNFQYPHPDCLGNGRYCSRDPDGSENYNNQKGKDATRQKLTSMCVYNNNDRQKWFDYQIRFATQCLDLASSALTTCSYNAMKELDIDTGAIKNCYNDSFYYDQEEYENRAIPAFSEDKMRNYYLEQEKVSWDNSPAFVYPALLVNGVAFKGDLNQKAATFEYICQGFIDEPKVCKEWDNWNYGEDTPTYDSYKNHFWSNAAFYICLLLSVIFVLYIVLYCYRRQTKADIQKELSLQVNSAMSQYWALNEKSSGRINEQQQDQDQD